MFNIALHRDIVRLGSALETPKYLLTPPTPQQSSKPTPPKPASRSPPPNLPQIHCLSLLHLGPPPLLPRPPPRWYRQIRMRPHIRTITMLRHLRHLHLAPPLPFQLRLVMRRNHARLSDPPELPGKDIEDFFFVEIHELRDRSPVSALGHFEIGEVSGRDELEEGFVIDWLEAEHSRYCGVVVRVARDIAPAGFLLRSTDGFGEEGFDGLEAAVVVCVGAGVEEVVGDALLAGDMLEGEVGAVDEGEEDVESGGALGERGDGVFFIVCEG